ncbi:MAG TPA: CehA/McbA family metallohydrolase [Steroidobacteraceae bacterium]
MNSKNGKRRLRTAACALTAFVGALAPMSHVTGHGTEARFVEFLDWKKEHFTKIFASNRAHLEGLPSNWAEATPQVINVEGRSCIVGQLIAFDVDDKYGFDLDEPVELSLTYASEYTTPFLIGYDKSGGTGVGLHQVTPAKAEKFPTLKLTLDRARFAGQATQGADIAIAAPDLGAMVVCDIKIARSNKTVVPTEFGTVKLSLRDAKTGGLVPARIGLYDSTGKAPLASDKALMLQRFADDLRMLAANDRTFWPTENRQVFYADGTYESRVPVGTYELVVGRGIEYQYFKAKVEVRKDRTTDVAVSLKRYADMPAAGWYSGDSHIHVTRDEVADPKIWGFVAAEDVHVGNLLEMGNIIKVYFDQPKAWGKASRFERDGHFIVSGQESPRTGFFGHTVHFNINRPVHLKTEEYFLYHKVFEDVKSQGGLAGFAHMGWGSRDGGPPKMNRGLTMLAPFGLVDFIEVLQGGRLEHEGWYRLLNLGYKVKPAAGTDWPYSDFPGVVRFYVNVPGPFNLDAWFDAYDKGRTFVTNGPLLDFKINGRGIGDELRVKRGTKLDLVASAKMNPELDALDRLEVVVLGDVAGTQSAAGKDSVTIRKQFTAERSMWVAVRAYGARQDRRNMTIAHSAPIYIVVDDEPTWKREAVPTIIAELRGQLKTMLTEPYETPITGNEAWENREVLTEQWRKQRPLLKPRIDMADAAYARLLDQWTKLNGAATAAGGAK